MSLRATGLGDEPSPHLAPPAETAPAAAAGRALAWTAAPVLAALLVREASRVSLVTASVPATALTVSALYVGSAVIAATPGVALVSVLARRRNLGPATVLGLLLAGSGGAAMAGFWARLAGLAFGRDFDVVLGVASVAVIAVFGRRGDLRAAGLLVPMLLALGTGLAFTGLAFIQGDGIAQHAVSAVAARYDRLDAPRPQPGGDNAGQRGLSNHRRSERAIAPHPARLLAVRVNH
jgi:hypothetical protein